MKVYKIRDWDQHFEVSQSRKIKEMRWVAMPTKHDGKGFRRIMMMEDGMKIFAAWVLIVQVAAKCPIRGTLADEGGPLDVDDLSLKTGCSSEDFLKALKVLCSDKIGWIVCEEWEHAGSTLDGGCQLTPSTLDEGCERPPATGPDRQDRTDNTNTGRAGVLSSVSQEMLADPGRVLKWFKRASTGIPQILEPTELNKISIVALAQRVIKDPTLENPAACFVDCVKKKNFKVTIPEEAEAKKAIRLFERGPPGERTADLSGKSKSRDQQKAEFEEFKSKVGRT